MLESSASTLTARGRTFYHWYFICIAAPGRLVDQDRDGSSARRLLYPLP